MNREYIVATYCVNIAKPTIHCKGKCHLAIQFKKLYSENENTAGSNATFKFQQIDQFVNTYHGILLTHSYQSVEETLYNSHVDFYHYNHFEKSIKPPINQA